MRLAAAARPQVRRQPQGVQTVQRVPGPSPAMGLQRRYLIPARPKPPPVVLLETPSNRRTDQRLPALVPPAGKRLAGPHEEAKAARRPRQVQANRPAWVDAWARQPGCRKEPADRYCHRLAPATLKGPSFRHAPVTTGHAGNRQLCRSPSHSETASQLAVQPPDRKQPRRHLVGPAPSRADQRADRRRCATSRTASQMG